MGPLPDVMAAAVYRSPGVIAVEERPVPRPGPDQLVVRVHACGICGSDIHQLRDGWGFKPGAVAGHEWSGTIVALGDDVTGWSVGELVVGGASPRCGTCRRCREDKPSQCENRNAMVTDHADGAFAEYVVARAAGVLRLPEGLSPRHAALAEPLSVALHGITRSGVGPDDSVMVFGAGPIGALSVAALRFKGITDITVVEPHEGRRRLAADLGASAVVDPADLEVFPSWEPERMSARAVHVVLECSGHRAAIEAGFHQLGRGGILVMVGAGIEHPTFDINRMILNELTVTGSFVYDLGGFERALELLASDGFPADLLIDPDDVTLDGIVDALEGLARRPHRRQGDGGARGALLMAHPYYPTGNPRFNHVAMSLPADLLGADSRADVCRFFSEVLGFEEIEVMTEDRRRLILSCVHWDQFIFLIAEDEPMRCPRMDHYGFAVGSLDELRGIQDRAEAFRASDDRMELIDLHVDDQKVVKIHSLYLTYILPMTVEFQYWEFPQPAQAVAG